MIQHRLLVALNTVRPANLARTVGFHRNGLFVRVSAARVNRISVPHDSPAGGHRQAALTPERLAGDGIVRSDHLAAADQELVLSGNVGDDRRRPVQLLRTILLPDDASGFRVQSFDPRNGIAVSRDDQLSLIQSRSRSVAVLIFIRNEIADVLFPHDLASHVERDGFHFIMVIKRGVDLLPIAARR